jgi:hypothetical protein
MAADQNPCCCKLIGQIIAARPPFVTRSSLFAVIFAWYGVEQLF